MSKTAKRPDKIKLKAVRTYPIFMGNGYESAGKCYDMLCKMQKAYSDLSALQQGLPDEEFNIEDENWLIATEIFESITGYKIRKVKKGDK